MRSGIIANNVPNTGQTGVTRDICTTRESKLFALRSRVQCVCVRVFFTCRDGRVCKGNARWKGREGEKPDKQSIKMLT